jgi:hypothetical protein
VFYAYSTLKYIKSTGVIGCAAVLHALAEKAEKGGSYGVDVSKLSHTLFRTLTPLTSHLFQLALTELLFSMARPLLRLVSQ